MPNCKRAECTMYTICGKSISETPMGMSTFRDLVEKAELKINRPRFKTSESENPVNILYNVCAMIKAHQAQAGYESCYEIPTEIHEFERIGFSLCDQAECRLYPACLYGHYGREEDFSLANFITEVLISEIKEAGLDIYLPLAMVSNTSLRGEMIEKIINSCQYNKNQSPCFQIGEKKYIPSSETRSRRVG